MMDSPKIGNGLPVIGPGPGIGISSLPMMGYLGKNFDSAKFTSDGYCPACREKGKLKALKTYQISFQESIFLCEDLQCIYPLGSKSLNNSISPDSEDCHTPNKSQKRKSLETSCEDSPFLANFKKARNNLVTDSEHVFTSKHNGEVSDEILSNSSDSRNQQTPVKTLDALEQNETLEAGNVDMATEEDVSGTDGISPHSSKECTSDLDLPSESSCSSLSQTLCVQWRNTNALCWLDCILSALVHLEQLKSTVTELCSREESLFWRLFEKYDHANKLLHTNQLDGFKDGDCTKLTSEIFAEIGTSLNEVRDEIFTKLQPQLRCTLGDMESPVFAFPLLLKIEPHVERLFTCSFSWDFECSQCGHQYQNRCAKSLVTFTNVIPEWYPLNAAHFGPCNNCKNKSQIRKMVLEKVSSIFMLHFVEGLPQNDLQRYAFHFEGCLYQITSVIQYQANNHFITWILDTDGSWLECDDLKGPCAERHKEFEVPASEIHIVIWERKSSHVTNKEASCLPQEKTDGQHASGGEQPGASPAACAVGRAPSAERPAVTQPTGPAAAPHSLSRDKAAAHEKHGLSSPQALVDSRVLPLTPEGTIQKPALVFQANPKAVPLENKPVAESTEPVKTSTLQPQKSLTAPSVSSPSEEKLIQTQFVDASFLSQVVNPNVQSVQPSTGNASVTQSVDTVHATDLAHAVKSVEVHQDTQLKQFLPPKTEKLNPEQHAVFPVSNLKKKEAAADSQTITAKSSQNQPLKENQKKPFVGSWVKGLLSRGASFMPPCVLAQNRNTVADLQLSVKGANNFGGFKTKGTHQKATRVSKKARRSAEKPPPVCSPPPGPPPGPGSSAAAPCTGVDAAPELPKNCESPSQGAHLGHSSHRNGSGVSSGNHGDSAEDQIHKLRLKLLKKLKAKKRKLAALMSSPQGGALQSEKLEHVPSCGSPNDCESIEDLLNELQYQIDTADSKSGCTTVPGVSSYTNQTHEEILAELLSPTTLSTELSENGEADFRYLEIGDDHVTAPAPSELDHVTAPAPGELDDIPQNAHLKQEHNYCSPTKRNQCEVQPGTLENSACIKTLNLESPMKTDIFDEFFSTSALNSLSNDTLDLPHFDEYLFENC